MPQQDYTATKMQHAQEIVGLPLVPNHKSAKVLQPGE
jgi:hypothetical protein